MELNYFLNSMVLQDLRMESQQAGVSQVMEDGKKKNPEHYFETKWNKKIALRAVEKMAEKCKEHEETCWVLAF